MRPSGAIAGVVDRAVNRTVGKRPAPLGRETAALHAAMPVVDLLCGSALFRRDLEGRGGGGALARGSGHLDLDRARAAGLDLVGLSIATRYPDLRGTLSRPLFRSLGVRPDGGGDVAIVDAFIRRIEAWASTSGGRLVLTRKPSEAAATGSDGALRAFIGVQGGQALDGDLRNVQRLAGLGVRMLGLAHVMDSPLAGSGTGRAASGLTGLGREAIAELERVGIIVDLAHASPAAVREAVPLLHRPFVVSHTGFTSLAGGGPRWRRYGPGRRNLPDELARLVGGAGGLIGVSLATPLIGGRSMEAVVRTFEHAVELAGPERVALGSDFDGALPMPFDVTGLPALTGALLAAGFGRDVVAGIMGGNALRLLASGGRSQ